MASPITPAAGTTVMSERSKAALSSCFVSMSTDRTAQRRLVRDRGDLIESELERLGRNPAELNHMAADLDAKSCEQLFRDCPAGDPSGCFPGRGALKHVAQVARVILQPARQVGVA